MEGKGRKTVKKEKNRWSEFGQNTLYAKYINMNHNELPFEQLIYAKKIFFKLRTFARHSGDTNNPNFLED
jgi:hypothetical protein